MYNVVGKLKHKVDVYQREKFTDEVGSVKYKYTKLKSIWCAITPILGERVRAVKQDKVGDMIKISETIKFTCRINAVKVSQDMYLVYKGQRYDVDYAVPYFKDMQLQEIYTQLRLENDDNLPKSYREVGYETYL